MTGGALAALAIAVSAIGAVGAFVAGSERVLSRFVEVYRRADEAEAERDATGQARS
ncbi:hypothetical protein SAMN06297387_12818 [Streptomyces zhaozhouensis]|uniref:Uncharacterized protein n=1 Tax=Streptomyces zhaozhouensis TaxID=1300267 RepID=A0A286E7V1_9ACTN|nr:hypothetical protein [Streptomyces zhaozhouensis]SOD66970.1 hypothetical protein SAMN06297387_12818 [Streptomyces zhaozhouensis]